MEKGETANGNAIPDVFLETGWIDAQEGDTFSRVTRYVPDWLTDSSINVKILHKNFPQAQTYETEDLGPINKATLKKRFSRYRAANKKLDMIGRAAPRRLMAD